MQFNDPIASGLFLVRESLRSPNYVPGSTGWTINADGSAEFSDVDIRGRLATGEAPDAYVELFDTLSGYAEIVLSTNDPNQITPAYIFATQLVGAGNALYLESPDIGFGRSRLKMFGQQSAISRPQIEFSETGVLDLLVKIFGDLEVTGAINTAGAVNAGSYNPTGTAQFRAINATHDIVTALNIYGALINGLTGLQAGPAAGLHINIDNNDIQAWNSGVSTTITINPNGSATVLGGELRLATGLFQTSVSPGTTGSAVNATWLNPVGTVWRLARFTSSRRYKENIRDLEIDIDKILALTPRKFQRNDHLDPDDETVLPVTESTPWDVGFIAEEAEELGLTEWVEYYNGEVDSFSYQLFVAAQQLVLRSQQKRIEELESRVTRLERILNV